MRVKVYPGERDNPRWLTVPLLGYRPAFDVEDIIKLRDGAIIDAHPDLCVPWYLTGADGRIETRGYDLHPDDRAVLVNWCNERFSRIGHWFNVEAE